MVNDLDAPVIADLIAYTGAQNGQAYIVLGQSSTGDIPARLYYYDSASIATPDGDNIIDATGMGHGRYFKTAFQPLKRQETYSGNTNSSGNYTVIFSNSFSVAPNIQANIIGGTDTQVLKVVSVSTTGFTINVIDRTPVSILGVNVLPGSVSNVNGAFIDVIVTEK